MMIGRRIQVQGTVQGVGFRPWVYRLARAMGVTGSVVNDPSGVTIDVFAEEGALDTFLSRLRTELPPAARIDRLASSSLAGAPAAAFRILESASLGERRPSIPPDLATCDACLAEILDPADRRYRYAFTSCTNCGPRYTIALDIPYDRARTTMAPFPMCAGCSREYKDPEDRRFHAEPNACPQCGPALRLEWAPHARPRRMEGDAIAVAAALVAEGLIVAVKGLGGWHLACDAGSDAAVRTLRRRKRRDEKPFAVMVRDAVEADALAVLDEEGRRLLVSAARPIVLATCRAGTRVSAAVAPDSGRLGIMLPYTPLHHLLLRDAGRPLVMTSGNVSDEPIACTDDDAFARLASIADAFLVHDREIASRTDDSVAMVIARRPLVVRRSRGYVPAAVPRAPSVTRPILGCGALLKNTFALGTERGIHLGPHIGDLENVETYESYRQAIERMKRFVRVEPELVAHDLHPDYMSTRYARTETRVPAVAVQHHHAHVASAMAEHGLEGPVLGVAFDGTGFGTDGTLWGGEVLVADYAGFERVASLRPLPLAGGDRAVREVWRTALAALDDAFDGDPPLAKLRLFDGLPPASLATVRLMIAQGLNAPRSSGAGRYFDAMGALGLGRARASYEGQVAMAWDQVADDRETAGYPFELDTSVAPWRVDLRPMVRGVASDLVSGASPGRVSARFHRTLVDATAEVVRLAARANGRMPVVLTGGCFQNARLVEGLLRVLGSDFEVFTHQHVPAGDGGIALGQVMVADALARRPG
jgi:hydrogenase maturation protein HypF